MGGRPKRSAWKCLDPYVSQLYKESLPEADELVKFHAVQRFIRDQVQRYVPNADIEAYGSVASNQQLRDSDVDLCMSVSTVQITKCNKKWKTKFLRTLGKILKKTKAVTRVDVRVGARVPVVCFVHTPSRLQVDINPNESGIFKASFIRTMVSACTWLSPFLRCLKRWARSNSLNDPTNGTLNSFCLSLLAINHLQTFCTPLLPPLWTVLPVPSTGEIPNQRPCRQDRCMHNGVDAPPETASKLHAATCEWRQTHAPPEQSSMLLEDILMAFFLRFSALLLARVTLSENACWATVSVWSGSYYTCETQSMKGQLKAETCRANIRPNDAEFEYKMVRNLLKAISNQWRSSSVQSAEPGRPPVPTSVPDVLIRALRAATLFMLPESIEKLKLEFKHILNDSDVRTKASQSPLWTLPSKKHMMVEVFRFLKAVLSTEWEKFNRRVKKTIGGERGGGSSNSRHLGSNAPQANSLMAYPSVYDHPSVSHHPSVYHVKCSQMWTELDERDDDLILNMGDPELVALTTPPSTESSGSISYNSEREASVSQIHSESSGDSLKNEQKAVFQILEKYVQCSKNVLAVEDPFDCRDNAARTLTKVHMLLAHALLPLLYGTAALAPCLHDMPPDLIRAPSKSQHVPKTAHLSEDDAEAQEWILPQEHLDSVRKLESEARQYEYPLKEASQQEAEVMKLANKWSSSVHPHVATELAEAMALVLEEAESSRVPEKRGKRGRATAGSLQAHQRCNFEGDKKLSHPDPEQVLRKEPHGVIDPSFDYNNNITSCHDVY